RPETATALGDRPRCRLPVPRLALDTFRVQDAVLLRPARYPHRTLTQKKRRHSAAVQNKTPWRVGFNRALLVMCRRGRSARTTCCRSFGRKGRGSTTTGSPPSAPRRFAAPPPSPPPPPA